MTLSPSEDRRSEGVDGPAYELNSLCPVPGCEDGHGLERHHLWRRSDVGDRWWVKTSDGLIHGNCIKLCRFHHREITDNIAHIAYSEGNFWWKDVLGEPQLLLWQPPASEEASTHVHVTRTEADVCPTCLRKLPQPKDTTTERPKQRKTWSVAVPIDHWEDGADVIDTLLHEAHTELNKLGLPYGEGKKVKYFILTAALGMFVTHASSLMSDQ